MPRYQGAREKLCRWCKKRRTFNLSLACKRCLTVLDRGGIPATKKRGRPPLPPDQRLKEYAVRIPKKLATFFEKLGGNVSAGIRRYFAEKLNVD